MVCGVEPPLWEFSPHRWERPSHVAAAEKRARAALRELVASELAIANQRIADGTPPASYYTEWVIAPPLSGA